MPELFESFTSTSFQERVRQIYHSCLDQRDRISFVQFWFTGTNSGAYNDLILENPAYRSLGHHEKERLRNDVRKKKAAGICLELLEAARSPENYLVALDDTLSRLVSLEIGKSINPALVVEGTCNILSRLPAIPVEIPGPRQDWVTFLDASKDYLADEDAAPNWDNLKIVQFQSTATISLAIVLAIADIHHDSAKEDLSPNGAAPILLNTMIELLEYSGSISSDPSTSSEDSRVWLVVRAFLWSTWQRCTMLALWHVLGLQLRHGFNDALREILVLHRLKISNEMDATELPETPPYICKWAFRLLFAERAALTTDFRRFLLRFEEAFPGRGARCLLNLSSSPKQCDGKAAAECQRFKGARITDQSAHSSLCRDPAMCPKLHWDERSYRSVQGARAVSLIENLPKNLLQYCQASDKTLAISHVWSHGQGGRPELNGTGLNHCLHRRYCRIAQSHGCESYWFDTPCIPQAHDLRAEAISHINTVFAHSKITLVCDRDLMDIDIKHASDVTKTNEEILCILLVCDWNVRAWTLLESMRGRLNIHVLCKNDRIHPVKEVIQDVYLNGCIDIAILALTSQQLMAPNTEIRDNMFRSDIPEASNMLGYRHASRPEDDVVIWSLMVNPEAFFDATKFWERYRGCLLRSGYLMSDLPRLSAVSGLSWAPSQPRVAHSIAHLHREKSESRLFSGKIFDGIGSSWGWLLPTGYRSDWKSFEFNNLSEDNLVERTWAAVRRSSEPTFEHVLADITKQFHITDTTVRLIYPGPHGPMQDEDIQKVYVGPCGGDLYAVVSSETGEAWTWRGLYEWPFGMSKPQFEGALLLLV